MLINGTSTANVLTGTLDDDQIFAMGGSDNIYASKGADTIDGGPGTDGVTVVLSRSDLFDPFTGPISITLTTGLLTDSSGQLNSSLTSIERANFNLGDIAEDITVDTTGFVSANANAISFRLGSGNNSYTGGNSADIVFLGSGYNVVDTGGGTDSVRAYFDSDGGVATVEYVDGVVLFRVGGVVTSEIRNAESIYIQESSTSIADGKTATIDASGFDISSGIQLALIDHNGDDIMIGSAGADFISNTSGFTVGRDIFTGNGGADIYDYAVAIDAMNDDVITDFDSDDTIDFTFNDGIIAGQELCYLWIGHDSFSGVAGQYRYYAADGQTVIEADVDGDTVADHILTLANGQFALGETYAGSNILQMIGQSGTDDADFLVGTLGDDIIFGQGGNDTIAATQGIDRVDGGDGTDQLRFVLSNLDRFDAATGPETYTIQGNWIGNSAGTIDTTFSWIESLYLNTQGTGDFGDTIDASAATTRLILRLGAGDDTVVGGSGNDDISLGLGSNAADGGDGYDAVFAQFDNSTGSTAYVTSDGTNVFTIVDGVTVASVVNAEEVHINGFYASGLVTTIDASGYVEVPGVALVLRDSNGSDVIIGSQGTDYLSNVSGNTLGGDTFTGNGGADIFDWTFASDNINGDVITDLDGDDILDFRFNNGDVAGASLLLCNQFIGSAAFGGVAGQYRYAASGGQTLIEIDTDGDAVADQTMSISNGQFALGETYGGSNILQIIGTSGTDDADFLVGANDSSDTIYAQGGNDTIAGTGGMDFNYGGDGIDQLRFVMSDPNRFWSAWDSRTITITDQWVGASDGSVNTYYFDMESLYLNTIGTGDFGDTIDGSAATTRLILRLGAGDDTVVGGSGNDDISLGLGANAADAGDGYDTVFATFDNSSGSTAYVTSDGTNVFTIVDGVTVASVVNAEEVHINGFYASGLTTTIDASGYVEVPGVALVLRDSNGSDVLIGSHGADFLSNVSGNTIGSDTFTGTGGADIFDWTFASDNINGDVITDLDADDVMDFRFNDGDVPGASPLICNQFIGSAFFSGIAGQYRYSASGGQTLIEVDTDGDSVADQTMSISNGQFALAETAPGSNVLHMVGTSGTGAADTLTGTLGDDSIYAQGGNDIINGSQGTDFVDGGLGGSDRLFMNTGDSSLFTAATGSRTYTIGASTITDSSGTLNTTFTGVERIAFSTVGNGDYDDVIDASGYFSGHSAGLDIRLGNGDNIVTGSSTNDRVWTGFGSSQVDGGDGDDIAFADIDASSDVTVTLTNLAGVLNISANGEVNQFTNVETVSVQGIGSGTVTLDASGYTDIPGVLLVLGGHDGTDIMIGSAGHDLFANATGQLLGNDVYTGNGGADIFDYTFAVDSLNGDMITDFDADDVIDLRFNNLEPGGSPLLANQFIGTADFGGVAGQYRYFAFDNQTFVQVDSDGDSVADQVLTIGNGQFALGETDPGSNILQMIGNSGTGAADTLTGTLGDDSIYAQGGNDTINGSQGNDFVDGGAGGTDRLFMRTGDSSLFTAATGSRTYTIGADSITDSSGTINTSFTGVERVGFYTVGNGDYDDVIDASGYVSGNSLALDIQVGNGDNLIIGSAFNDRITTGYGSNIIDGGAGYDFSQVLLDSTSDVTVTISNVDGTLVTDADGAVNQLTGMEEVWVFGIGSGAVTLDASGYTGVDGLSLILVGHDGSDIMIGSAGEDFFANITGQVSGNDVYTGNGGADIYDYTWAADSMNGDTITDFDIDDVIDLRFNTLQPGQSPVLANHFIGAEAFSGTAGEYRYQIDGTITVVQVDSDGDTIVDQTLTISNGGFELAEVLPGINILTLAAVINPVEGVVADGYVAGATLFVDVNGNGVLDDGEAWTVTDANGNYSLNVNQAGTIVAVGGTNADTGLANEMTLLAPYDSTVVNPLTTLVAAIMEQSGLDAAAAQDAVKDAFGLDSSLDLLTTDLLSAGGNSALEAQKAAAMVANLVTTAETVTGAGTDAEASTLGVLAGLVAGGGSVDLTDAGTIETILESALPAASGLDVVADQLAAEGDTIAEADSLEDISAAQATAQLSGDDLANVITGNDLANALFGNGGSDRLFGLGGDDRLTGGDGVDYLTGGAGNDVFVAEIGATRVASKSGPISFDVITDFSSGDRIDLSSLDANALVAGDQDFHWMSTNANKAAGDLSIKVYDSVKGAEKALGIDIDGTSGPSPYSGPVTVLFGNVDGGSPDFAIALLNTNGFDPSGLIF